MKVIELVFLIGAQCVSPVQNAPGLTEVAKVQCAVVIERDSETNIVRVTPESAAALPRVAEAVKRVSMPPVAAAAPPPPQQPLVQNDAGVVRLDVPPPPPAIADRTSGGPPPAAAENKPDPAPQKEQLASVSPESAAAPETPEPVTAKPAARSSKEATNLCGAGRKAVWYTASPGHRKYRCRSADDSSRPAAELSSPKKSPAKKKTPKSRKKTRNSLY